MRFEKLIGIQVSKVKQKSIGRMGKLSSKIKVWKDIKFCKQKVYLGNIRWFFVVDFVWQVRKFEFFFRSREDFMQYFKQERDMVRSGVWESDYSSRRKVSLEEEEIDGGEVNRRRLF